MQQMSPVELEARGLSSYAATRLGGGEPFLLRHGWSCEQLLPTPGLGFDVDVTSIREMRLSATCRTLRTLRTFRAFHASHASLR